MSVGIDGVDFGGNITNNKNSSVSIKETHSLVRVGTIRPGNAFYLGNKKFIRIDVDNTYFHIVFRGERLKTGDHCIAVRASGGHLCRFEENQEVQEEPLDKIKASIMEHIDSDYGPSALLVLLEVSCQLLREIQDYRGEDDFYAPEFE